MTWLIFALSIALAAAGAISIASGLPYIQMEWGWTETIAGAVAVSAGVVTFALAAILHRLTVLQRVFQNGPSPLASGELGFQEAVVPDDAGANPFQEVESSQPATGGPRTSGATRDAYAEDALGAGRASPSTSDAAPAEPQMPLEHTDAELRAEAADEVREETADEQPRVNWAARLRSRFRKGGETPAAEPLPEPELGLDLRPSSNPDQPEPSAARSPDLSVGTLEGSGPTGEDRGNAIPESSVPEGAIPRSAGQASGDGGQLREAAEVEPAAPTIVGRYEAAGVSYLLLSDGAIEVKTETGVHRFASLQELKQFIEAQELQGSAQDR